jgi:hypothetical protein
MVKVISPQQETSNDGTKKQRKKQAKREAKTMLKLEQVKKDAQKAEQKVAKAKAQLEANQTRLRELEEELNQIRSSQPEGAQTPQTASHAEEENHADTSTPTSEVTSLPPVGGRSDIDEQAEASSSGQSEGQAEATSPSTTERHEEQLASSDQFSSDEPQNAAEKRHEETPEARTSTTRTSHSRRRSHTPAGNSDIPTDQ